MGVKVKDTEVLQLGDSVTVNYLVKGIAVVVAPIAIVAGGETLNANELITHVMVTVKVFETDATDEKLANATVIVIE